MLKETEETIDFFCHNFIICGILIGGGRVPCPTPLGYTYGKAGNKKEVLFFGSTILFLRLISRKSSVGSQNTTL